MERSAWEANWLEYAKGLMCDLTHRNECDRRLGSVVVGRADAADLRWPGYVGEAYRPGGLLIAATVHREFASGRPPLSPRSKDDLINGTRAWRDSQISDDEWLAVLRSTYRAGLGRSWTVGKLLRALGTRIGTDVRSVAYVNAARCQVVESEPVADKALIIGQVVDLCSRAYPLADLARILEPGALVISKGTFDAIAADLPSEVPLFVADQRQLCLRVPYATEGTYLPKGTLIDEWAPELGRLLEAAS